MSCARKMLEQKPNLEQLSVLQEKVVQMKETLKGSFYQLPQNDIIFKTIDAKRRKLNECEIINTTNSFGRNEKRKFDEVEKAVIKPNLINYKKIKHTIENDTSTYADYQYMESINDIKTNKFINKLKNYVHKLPTIIEEDEEEGA